MRIIYEDGNYREEREKNEKAQNKDSFVDVSSMSDEYKNNLEKENTVSKPYRPAATLRPVSAEKQKESEAKAAPAPQQMYPPVQPPQGYGGQPGFYPYPQGYPMQYMQYPRQYPQGYPIPYQQMPQPTQYPPQVQYTQPQPTAQVPSAMPDSGTRVIYQSPDFDNKEGGAQPPAVSYGAPSPRVVSLTQEDVVIASSSTVRGAGSAKMHENKFDVDDMEMSVFELNSMAHKYHTKSKAYKNPSARDGSLEVEEYEEPTDYLQEEGQDITEGKPKKKKSKKAKKRREIIRKTVLCISLIAIAVSSFYLYNEFRMSSQNEKDTEKAQGLIIDDSFLEDTSEQDSSQNGTDESENSDEGILPPAQNHPQTLEEKWAEVKKEYPKVDFPSDIQLKYAKLYGTNQDFVGYLSAEGVGMDLPVVQGENDETYLKKSFFGENTKYGCPFVTHLNNITSDKDGLDMNTVIFGHHMKNGSVFGVLDEYKSIEGFKAAPVISFNTLYHDYDWKIIGAFLTNAYEKDDNGYVFKYYFTNLSTEERFSAYLNAVNERSLYYTGVDVLPTDKILTLSTCSYEFEDARFVVVARLVRHGESTEVDVSKATENENPRYPQAYYDKKKQDNPYKDAYKWEVG